MALLLCVCGRYLHFIAELHALCPQLFHCASFYGRVVVYSTATSGPRFNPQDKCWKYISLTSLLATLLYYSPVATELRTLNKLNKTALKQNSKFLFFAIVLDLSGISFIVLSNILIHINKNVKYGAILKDLFL